MTTPPVKGLFVQISVRIPEPLRRRAKIVAAKHNITLSQMLVHGLETMLKHLDEDLAHTLADLKASDPLEMGPEAE